MDFLIYPKLLQYTFQKDRITNFKFYDMWRKASSFQALYPLPTPKKRKSK